MKAMQRTLLGCAAFASLALASPPLLAQDFYRAGKVSVALERGFGIHYLHEGRDRQPPQPDGDIDATTFGIGWYGALTPLHWTRAAVDVFVVERLSLGGSLAFFGQSGDRDAEGILFAPRVGYAVPLSSVISFWPRGGVVFYDLERRSAFGLSGEAMFVVSPRPSWGVLFGPTLDLAFSGDDDDGEDFTEFALGIVSVGLIGMF
jgi:hypothetical protein